MSTNTLARTVTPRAPSRRRPVARPPAAPAPAAPTIAFRSVDDIPDRYGMVLRGDCLHPVLKDGDILGFSKSEPFAVGDFCIFILKPELVQPGQCQSQIKRLHIAPPPDMTFPYLEHPESEVHALVMAEMLNPPRRFMIKCEHLLAIHKCIGPATPTPETAHMVERLAPAQNLLGPGT